LHGQNTTQLITAPYKRFVNAGVNGRVTGLGYHRRDNDDVTDNAPPCCSGQQPLTATSVTDTTSPKLSL